MSFRIEKVLRKKDAGISMHRKLPKKLAIILEVFVLKKIGLVGGIGPESTVDYYKEILDGYRKRTADEN